MSTAHETDGNCIDIVRDLDEYLREQPTPYQLLGGIGSAALKNTQTYIDVADRRIIAPSDFSLSIHRENGTLRDVDLLLFTSDQGVIESATREASSVIDNRLKLEVFSLKSGEKIDRQLQKPLGRQAIMTVVSDRYERNDGIERVLFPFATPIDSQSLEPWTLDINGNEFPIPDPGTTMTNYLTRSISGLRPKDRGKVAKMAESIRSKAPDIVQQTLDGYGKDQVEFARVLHTLRRGSAVMNMFGYAHAPLDHRTLAKHQSFMLTDNQYSDDTKKLTLAIATLKSRGLGIGELLFTNPFQRLGGEEFFRRLIHND